jgi:hypothetical protein
MIGKAITQTTIGKGFSGGAFRLSVIGPSCRAVD